MGSLTEMTAASELPSIGVIIVAYAAETYIMDCLESLVASGYPNLRIIVVDNASPDKTSDVIRGWADGSQPYRSSVEFPLPKTEIVPKPLPLTEFDADAGELVDDSITLVHSSSNLGFAGGVNVGLRLLLRDLSIDLFWLLNPDTVVEPQTPFAFARKASEIGKFGVIGGRALFFDNPDRIHADAGRLHALAGTAISVNRGEKATETPMPDIQNIDYIPGISMMVSRAFINKVGFMDERFFLYFEEIDWQLRRGDLPIVLECKARVLHRAGAAIGSGNLRRRANPFSIYFTTRNLLPFVARWQLWKLPFAYAMAWWRLTRQWGIGRNQVSAMLCGLHGLGPPSCVRSKLSEETWEVILSSRRE